MDVRGYDSGGTASFGSQPTTPNPSGGAPQGGPGQPQIPSNPAPKQPSGIVGPLMAADSDAIETQWVEVAKAAILQNQSDPYQASAAFAALRQDYLKKRYGKELKVID